MTHSTAHSSESCPVSLSLVCFSVQALGPHILNLVTLAALSHRLKKSKSGADSYIPVR